MKERYWKDVSAVNLFLIFLYIFLLYPSACILDIFAYYLHFYII